MQNQNPLFAKATWAFKADGRSFPVPGLILRSWGDEAKQAFFWHFSVSVAVGKRCLCILKTSGLPVFSGCWEFKKKRKRKRFSCKTLNQDKVFLVRNWSHYGLLHEPLTNSLSKKPPTSFKDEWTKGFQLKATPTFPESKRKKVAEKPRTDKAYSTEKILL